VLALGLGGLGAAGLALRRFGRRKR
jgi:hypothetical protein